MFAWIRYSKNVMFTVLSFGQVNNVFGLLYSVILQGQIWPSFLGHLNSPRYVLWLNLNILWHNCSKYVKISNFLTFSACPSFSMQYTASARKTRVLAYPVSLGGLSSLSHSSRPFLHVQSMLKKLQKIGIGNLKVSGQTRVSVKNWRRNKNWTSKK